MIIIIVVERLLPSDRQLLHASFLEQRFVLRVTESFVGGSYETR